MNILRGMIIGVANIIPGVSGGTLAVVLGVYADLTEAVGEFLTRPEKRKEYAVFLFKIGLGAVLGILVFARIFTLLLENPVPRLWTYAVFLGLIAGSVPLIARMKVRGGRRGRELLFFLLGAALVALFLFGSLYLWGGGGRGAASSGAEGIPNYGSWYGVYLAVCGFLAAASMVVPGFSGSALLVALGEYENILSFVDQREMVPLVLVGTGAVLGILTAARLIERSLRRFPGETYAAILGLIAGSLAQIGRETWLAIGVASQTIPSVYAALGTAAASLAGFFLAWGASRIP